MTYHNVQQFKFSLHHSKRLLLLIKTPRFSDFCGTYWGGTTNKYQRYAKSTLPSTSRKNSSSCPDRVSALRRVMSLTMRFVVCCILSTACYCHHMLLQVNGLCLILIFRHGVRSGLLSDFRQRRVKYPYTQMFRSHLYVPSSRLSVPCSRIDLWRWDR
jgi:hypothetical protein